jgi:hypothetical protein
MRRPLVILILGLVGAVVSYCAIYFSSTSRQRALMEAPAPELAWLQQEFSLSDLEFQRISQLHDGYLPRCAEMCRRIAAKNTEIKQLFASTNIDAAAVEQKLAEAAQLRVQCQTNMLRHFIAVSRQMPPEQGRRYLTWIEERAFGEIGGMMAQHEIDKTDKAVEAGAGQHHHH